MSLKRILFAAAFASAMAVPASAQSSECEIVLMPMDGRAADGQFSDASTFLDSVYDGDEVHMESVGDLPVRAIMCRRDDLVPTMRDLPILKTGLPLSISQNFDSPASALLTLYDAGADFKAEYSGPKLSPADEKRLRDTLEIFNFQKFIK